jgi:hypothetical protein
MMRAKVSAASGQILPDQTRAGGLINEYRLVA